MGSSFASLFRRFPHFAYVEKHSVFQNWAQVGAHARVGVSPRAELCFLSLPAHYGLIHKRERKSAAQGGTPVTRGKGVNPSPAIGRDLHTAPSPFSGGAAGFTLLTHRRPRRQPQFTAISTGQLARGTFAEGSRPTSVWQKNIY